MGSALLASEPPWSMYERPMPSGGGSCLSIAPKNATLLASPQNGSFVGVFGLSGNR